MKRLLLLWRVGRQDLRLLWFALRHPNRPLWLLPAAGLLALFALEPANFAIPLLGAVDAAKQKMLAIGQPHGLFIAVTVVASQPPWRLHTCGIGQPDATSKKELVDMFWIHGVRRFILGRGGVSNQLLIR